MLTVAAANGLFSKMLFYLEIWPDVPVAFHYPSSLLLQIIQETFVTFFTFIGTANWNTPWAHCERKMAAV